MQRFVVCSLSASPIRRGGVNFFRFARSSFPFTFRYEPRGCVQDHFGEIIVSTAENTTIAEQEDSEIFDGEKSGGRIDGNDQETKQQQ